ncbi:MAG: hypothetical protein IJ424_05680 [Oscillospiraceae bacterium]|nr:hypothetical protein [Oscillospiraceae bacterium]
MDQEKNTLVTPENEEKQAVFGFLKAVAFGVAICEAITVLVFALIGRFSLSVVLGAVYGGLVMILYYYLMAGGITKAAKEPDPEVAKKRMQLSYSQRLMVLVLLLGVGLFLYAEFGIIHWIPMALSIIYPRIALGIWQQRYKKIAKDEPLTAGNPDAYADIDEKEEEADF